MGNLLGNLTLRLVQLPRLIRIGIALFFAVMVALAIFSLVDHIYLRYLFTEETRMLPALVTVTIASIMYIWGWWGYIGVVNTTPAPTNFILGYFMVGIIATITVIVLVIQGFALVQ